MSENGRIRQVQVVRGRTGQSDDSAVEAVRSTRACAERCAQSTEDASQKHKVRISTKIIFEISPVSFTLEAQHLY